MDDEEEGSRAPLLIGLGVFFLAALGVAYFLFGRKPEVIPAPAGYTAYLSPDKTFACLSPNGWKKSESAGGGIMSGVVFTKSKAKVNVTSDLQGSLMADISRGPSLGGIPGMGGMPQRPPVEKLHLSTTNGLKKEFKEYSEKPMRELPNMALGDTRVSEWTGDAGLLGGGKIHGYRTTILNNDRRTVVICHCPESSWTNLKPAFQKIVASLKPGGGG